MIADRKIDLVKINLTGKLAQAGWVQGWGESAQDPDENYPEAARQREDIFAYLDANQIPHARIIADERVGKWQIDKTTVVIMDEAFMHDINKVYPEWEWGDAVIQTIIPAIANDKMKVDDWFHWTMETHNGFSITVGGHSPDAHLEQ